MRRPVATPIIGLNRALTWFWWTAALLEIGDDDAAAWCRRPARWNPRRSRTGGGAELQVSLLARGPVGPGEDQGDDVRPVWPSWVRDVEGHAGPCPTQAHLALAHAHLRAGRLEQAGAEGRAAQGPDQGPGHGLPTVLRGLDRAAGRAGA